MLRVSVGEVLLPTLTACRLPIRKSRIQLPKEIFNSRVPSLVMSLEGTMLLNAEIVGTY
jgi:hypothetical protein